MFAVVLVIHLMIVCVLVGVVLLQRSEGGALGGLGGGSGGLGGFMTGRGAANVLTRTTAVLAACFFLTSIALSIIAGTSVKPRSILETAPPARSVPAPSPVAPVPAPTPAAPSAPLPE